MTDHLPRGRAPESKLPSVDDLLGWVLGLNTAVLAGLVSPAKASVLQKGYQIVLGTLSKRQQEAHFGVADKWLDDLRRASPEVRKFIEPLLTDEQIAWLLHQDANENPDDSENGDE